MPPHRQRSLAIDRIRSDIRTIRKRWPRSRGTTTHAAFIVDTINADLLICRRFGLHREAALLYYYLGAIQRISYRRARYSPLTCYRLSVAAATNHFGWLGQGELADLKDFPLLTHSLYARAYAFSAREIRASR